MKRIYFGLWRAVAALAAPSRHANLRRLLSRNETAASFTIRDATPADIPKIVPLHVTAWNATYAPMLIRGPSHEVREMQWRKSFAMKEAGWFCLVVERPDGEIIGFAQGNKSDHPKFGGELNKIYLHRDYQRVGVGRRLVGHVARRFLNQGITSMWLYGDARNPSSRAWKAMGAKKTDNDPGNGNYGWLDLTGLARFPD